MPVKANKKIVSKKKRKEIREAVGSLPGLIIEHVARNQYTQNPPDEGDKRPNKKYMLSEEKRREHQKKKVTVYVGVGVILISLAILWVVNIKTFFFDSSHTISTEEEILHTIKNDFKNTVGTVSTQTPSFASSTEEAIRNANLEAALLSGLSSSTSSTMTTSSVTSTPLTTSTPNTPTSSPDETHFPVAEISTSSQAN